MFPFMRLIFPRNRHFTEDQWGMSSFDWKARNYMAEEEHQPLLRHPNSDVRTEWKSSRRNRTRAPAGPDGFLAWIVAFANFFINFVVVGLGRMSGILYVVFMDMFRVDRRTAALPFSVQQAARNLFGPLAGILGQKYGVRAVTVVGGFIGVISAVVCFFTTDMNWITIMWGLVFGICTALTTTLNQVTIDQYFERHQTTAGGLAFSGGCVGAFFFPVVLELLIRNYGMSGTFLVMGAILLNVVPAALFLKEPPWKKKGVEQETQNAKKRVNDYNTFRDLSRNSSTLREEDFVYLEEKSEIVYQLFLLTLICTDESILESHWTSIATDPLVDELRSLYYFIRSKPTMSGTRIAGGASQVGIVVNELTRNVHEVRVTRTESNGSLVASKSASPYRFLRYEDNPQWVFLSRKLRELCDRDKNDVLSYFLPEDNAFISRVLDLLRKLDRAVRIVEDSSFSATLKTGMANGEATQQSLPLIPEASYEGHQPNIDPSEALQNGPQDPTEHVLPASAKIDDLRTPTIKVELVPNGPESAYDPSDPTTTDGTGTPNGEPNINIPASTKSEDLRRPPVKPDASGTPEQVPDTEPNLSAPTEPNVSAPTDSTSSAGRPSRHRSKNPDKAKDSNSFLAHIRTAVYLHRNPLFLLICLCRGVFMLTFIPMVTVIVDFAIDQGLERDTGKYVIAVLSLGDLLGRLCLGWINDTGCLSLSRYMLIAMLLLGCSTATLPFMKSEVSLLPAILLFGMLQGSLFVRHQVLVSKYMDGHEQAIGMGFINMLSGFLGFALPAYIGYFRDSQGSYDGMLYVNGLICACVGLLWIFEPFFRRWTSKSSSYNKLP